MLASQSIPSWNQIIAWLKEMEILRRAVEWRCSDGFLNDWTQPRTIPRL